MSRPTLCQVCEAAEARFACDACGAMVCLEHFDQNTGLCAECARSGGGPRI